jgi:5-formyltetrahydrofolate cyclo-ligase
VPDFSDEAEVARAVKADLRVAMLAHRRSLPADLHAAAAALVQAELADLVRRVRPRRVTAYVPVGTEPGGPDLPDALLATLAPDGELLLPLLRADLDLDWAAYPGPGSLAVAGRGLREPRGRPLGVAAVSRADLVVVPAVAVDRRGIRLGRGGGSYDRALARIGTEVMTVALLHDGELVDALPAEPHDRGVRAVITPSAGLRLLPAA